MTNQTYQSHGTGATGVPTTVSGKPDIWDTSDTTDRWVSTDSPDIWDTTPRMRLTDQNGRVRTSRPRRDDTDRWRLGDDHTMLAQLGLIRQARPNVVIDAYGREQY